jgi:hypothetical protein
MNKSLLILAAVVFAFSFSFAKKPLSADEQTRQFRVEKSRDCRLVCENGEIVQYKGNRKISNSPQVQSGGLGEMVDSRECPILDFQMQTAQQLKKFYEECASKNPRGKKRN